MFQNKNILLLFISSTISSEHFGQEQPEAKVVIPAFGPNYKIKSMDFPISKNEKKEMA